MSLIRGKFIVFEGIDGSGTSTQAEKLYSYFIDINKRCSLTCEPSNGPIGNMIRQAFKGRLNLAKGMNPNVKHGDLFDEQMAYLFAADRHDHLYNEIDGVVKLVNDGVNVISTRYYFSSYAYHCTSEEDFELVTSLNARFPEPDLVVFLDNPIDVSMSRMQGRAFKDEYENERKLSLVKENYRKIFEVYSGETIFINAADTIQNIHKTIVDRVSKLI